MDKMTQAEKFTAVRNEAFEDFVDFGNTEAYQVAVGTWVAKTANGWAKVTVQAVKDTDFNAVQAEADYQFDVEQKAANKQAKADEKARKAAVRAAEKAKNAKVK